MSDDSASTPDSAGPGPTGQPGPPPAAGRPAGEVADGGLWLSLCGGRDWPAGAHTVGMMVTSADGTAVVDGRVGPLTGPDDQEVLTGARERADVVLVGAATVAAEGYEGLLGDEAKQRRQKRGLDPEPTLAIISRHPEALEGAGVLGHPDMRVVVCAPPGAAGVVQRLGAEHVPTLTVSDAESSTGAPSLQALVTYLRDRLDAQRIVVEGGPHILGWAVAQGALDQCVIVVSPQFAGGDPHPITGGNPLGGTPTQLRIGATIARNDFLFTRYVLDHAEEPDAATTG